MLLIVLMDARAHPLELLCVYFDEDIMTCITEQQLNRLCRILAPVHTRHSTRCIDTHVLG